VDTQNLRIGFDLFYSGEKPQIVLRERCLEEIFLGLLRLGKLYLHGEWTSEFNAMCLRNAKGKAARKTTEKQTVPVAC
jgi:hypothetical protein